MKKINKKIEKEAFILSLLYDYYCEYHTLDDFLELAKGLLSHIETKEYKL